MTNPRALRRKKQNEKKVRSCLKQWETTGETEGRRESTSQFHLKPFKAGVQKQVFKLAECCFHTGTFTQIGFPVCFPLKKNIS